MKKRTTFLIIPMLIALISSICFTACDYQVAQLDGNKTENENPIVNPEVKTGTITGKALYTNADDNSGIIISLEKTAGNISASVTYCAYNVGSRSISGSTTTSSDGSYKFENVEEGTYTVYASSDKSSEKAVFTNISVQADTTTTVSDLKLTATGTISGIITLNESATGNEAFLVFVAGTSYMAMTDSAGKYTISGVPAGTNYQLLVTKGKLTKTIASNVTITANENTTIPDLNFSDEDVNGKEEKTTSELQIYFRDPELNISYTTDYTDYDIPEAVSDDINRPTQLGKGTYNISIKVVYCISAYSKEIYHSEKDELPLSEILKYDPNFKISTTSDLISFSEDFSEMTVKAATNDEQLTDVIKLKVLFDGEESVYYLNMASWEGFLPGTNKWWTYEHQQKVGSDFVTLNFYFFYNTKYSYHNKNIRNLDDSDFVNGLNVVIAADPEADTALLETIETGFSKSTFILITLPEDEKISGSINLIDAWLSFYTINTPKSDAKLTNDYDYPPILASRVYSRLVGDDIDMKRILVNILLGGISS